MHDKKLSFQINHEYKVINLSYLDFIHNDITYPLHYNSDGNISHGLLRNIVKFLIKSYQDYTFWWMEYMEFVSPNEPLLVELIKIFEDLNSSHKIKIIDNNLSKFRLQNFKIPKYYYSEPTSLGFTANSSLDINVRKFDKKFICLNRVDRPHRRIVFDYMNRKHQSDSFLSYAPMEENNPRRTILDNPDISEIGNLENAFTTTYQLKSFCNIITETLTYNSFIHITEKIDKCFSAGQPFLLVAGMGYLTKLKELGFKTFDKWWDESYDREMLFSLRIEKIKKNIDTIASWSIEECEKVYTEMIPTLIHNQKLCIEYSKSKYHVNQWDRIYIDFYSKKSLV